MAEMVAARRAEPVSRIEALVTRLEADVRTAQARCEQIASGYAVGRSDYREWCRAAESRSIATERAVGARMALEAVQGIPHAEDPIACSVAEGLIDAEEGVYLRARFGGFAAEDRHEEAREDLAEIRERAAEMDGEDAL